MRDARRPAIVFNAAASGKVANIERGKRRKLLSLRIDLDKDQVSTNFDLPATQDKASLRSLMLASGIWTGLQTRPFGKIPDPDGEPAAIFVTAMDNELQAPDPLLIINSYAEEFKLGVTSLAGISEAPLYVCHASSCVLPLEQSAGIHCIAFAEGHSSALPGVHINALCPIGFSGGEVWHIGYQDVISLGHLLLHGNPWLERIINVTAPGLADPKSLRVIQGASIADLIDNESWPGPINLYSGSELRGRLAIGAEAYLGARHRQVSVVARGMADVRATKRVLIPTDNLESMAPPGIFPVPLMRALQVGDVDRARDLGALELVEEDLALLSQACQSQCDYGTLLRQVLNQLEGAA